MNDMVFKIFAMALVAAVIVFIVIRLSKARPQRAGGSTDNSTSLYDPNTGSIFSTVDRPQPDDGDNRRSGDGGSDSGGGNDGGDGHSDTGGGTDSSGSDSD